ncbi:MAG: lipocalin-like domain-containing protein [Bryobacteraceae bacterium]
MKLCVFLWACALMAQNSRFLGVWKLVSYELRTPDGKVTQPMGPNPVGRITYDSEGRMSAQLMDPRRAKFGSSLLRNGTAAEKAAAADGYAAYYGRFTVREKEGIVVHHVDASLFPNWVGGDQIRYFEFSGGRLILRAKRDTGESRLVWERDR